MNRKLTLSLDENAIARGKRFAKNNDTSLSQMVETFLIMLDDEGEIENNIKLSDKLMSLVGIGAGDFTEEDHRRHLEMRNAE